MRSFRRSQGPDPVSPSLETMMALVCVVFVLLLFFIVRLNFTKQAGIDLVGPAPGPGENRLDPLVIRVSSAGTVHWRGARIDLSSLRHAIEDARFISPRAPLVVMVETGARASLVVRVVDQLKLTGATDIRLTMTMEESSEAS